MNVDVRIELDGGAIARAMLRHLATPLERLGAVAAEARARTINADQAFRAIALILRHDEANRRRRAKYEIREAIAARRIGVAPQPWRGR